MERKIQGLRFNDYFMEDRGFTYVKPDVQLPERIIDSIFAYVDEPDQRIRVIFMRDTHAAPASLQ